jgi:hypothetical protein
MMRMNNGEPPCALNVCEAAAVLDPNEPCSLWVAQWVNDLDDALFCVFIRAGGREPLLRCLDGALGLASLKGTRTEADMLALRARAAAAC